MRRKKKSPDKTPVNPIKLFHLHRNQLLGSYKWIEKNFKYHIANTPLSPRERQIFENILYELDILRDVHRVSTARMKEKLTKQLSLTLHPKPKGEPE